MKTERNTAAGHLAAFFTIIVWSTTYISTKVLLKDFTPLEILFFRCTFAYILLYILSPKPLIPKRDKEELLFAGAGLCGITLYFMCQNTGLTYTLASNAGVLVSVAPMFTAIIAHIMGKGSGISRSFVLGFFVAVIGAALISFNGSFILKLNPLGDILIMTGALSWAVYSNLISIAGNSGYSLIQKTRKVFFYGLLFMLPAMAVSDFRLDLYRLAVPENLFNILFLGLGASAVCFITWNFTLNVLGPVKTNAYIYLSPVITIAFSAIILDEPVTVYSAIGTVLILAGLVASEYKSKTADAAGSDNE